MQALVFDLSIPKYVAAKGLGRFVPSLYTGPLSCLSLREVPAPKRPGDDWVRLESLMAGLCGSDLATIFFKASTALEPFNSFPAVLGHEVLARVVECGPGAGDLEPGQRVAVDPFLPCGIRGFDHHCVACDAGALCACERMAEGCLAPGMLIGFHRELPGGMGRELVAHRSQIYPLPDRIPDAAATLMEPLSVGMRAVLQNRPKPGERVLVIGGGMMAFAVLWSLAAAKSEWPDVSVTLLTVEGYQLELARQMGAAEVIQAQADAAEAAVVAGLTGGKVYQPIVGPPTVSGGFDVVYDCVGSSASINDSLRYTRALGRVALVGAAGVLDGVDWTPVWRHELTVRGSMAYGLEDFRGVRQHTYEVVRALLAEGEGPDPSPLVTHTFPLSKYRQAIEANIHRGKHRSIKTVFDLRLEG
jgi:L-iditol 2-dehydrogenase